MRLGTVIALGTGIFLSSLAAQECPAVVRIPPAGSLSGALNASDCLLTDGTPYLAYRLDLPARGKIAFDLSGPSSGLQLILRNEYGARLDAGTSIHRPIEAGSYRLLVNGKPGAFTIATTFSPEASMLCANFPSVGRRQTITNTLGSYGCSAPDGSPFDAWSLATFGAGTLTVTAASQDFAPTLTLRGSNGRALATSTNGTLTAPVQGDSQYLIVVASAGLGGAYQLTTAFQNAPDDACRSARTFTASDTSAGAIAADSCYVTLPGSGDQIYFNYYNITVGAVGVATFSVSSGDFAPTLYLLDESGNTLAVDFAGGGYDSSGNARSYLRVPLGSGNYVLEVFSDVSSGGAYQLEYGYKPGAPEPCTAATANLGGTQSGTLSTASCRTAFGLTDLYAFTLSSAGTLDLDLSSIDFPTTLAIADPQDNLIVRSDEVDGVTAAHITADLPAGVYTVTASARSNAGAYRLTSNFSGHDVPPCNFTQTIDLNGGYIQRLNPASCRGANGQPVDYYGFTLSADSLVLGVVTSSEVDGYLTLLDSSGNILRTDDNSYGGIDPLIVQYLPAGSYKLAVSSASAANGGLYEVDLRTVEGSRPVFCSAKSTLRLDSSVTGNIGYTGCQYGQQTFADIYQLTLSSDATVDLHLNSSEFDAYLVLLDAKGNVVEEDDDSGGNTNARAIVPLAAGTYYVVAKPLGDYLNHGAYTLSAAAVDPAALQK